MVPDWVEDRILIAHDLLWLAGQFRELWELLQEEYPEEEIFEAVHEGLIERW